ncbi:ATP-dependent DNA ligase [Artomyces pyxidatus]|uniref:ATP-dependent DNA ligase n=1 Tax=Artomyces pyxidatus TaxID=48021 RepID=A0ACB8STE9_9AGAM|nr:ATP-dependent DNA ligase [Artomyces pyxidatus]
MMQPTPAPTSPAGSPAPQLEPHEEQYPDPPENKGSPPFSVLSGLFEKLQNERKQEKRRKLLDTWFEHWRKEVGFDLYPVLRLILPQKDRERAIYGLKEKNLAKSYIKLIPLGAKDPDAVRLLNWKKPTEHDKSSGDFPTVLYEVVGKRSSVLEGTLTIDELNDVLDELSKNIGKQDVQSRVLQRVYNRSTPEEQRWIVRIILKDMVISVKETTVFSVFHPDAHDLFNTCSDLKKVAWELWDPKRRLNAEDKSVQLFRAFAPMLCKRPTKKIEESVKEMSGRTFIIEEKLDGERIQLHKRGNEYFYCSRKGKDYTYLYGKHVGTGSLTPYINTAFDDRIDDIILDGEMLVWDPISERNLPFGTLKSAALDKSKKEHNPRPCFKVFDLLYLNGMSLIHKSTEFRKRNLKACIKEIPGRFEFVAEFEGKTAKDVRKKMDDVMADRGEGLVLKHPDSEYVLNGRNKDWIKVKPEYMDNLGETVDVLVVGGNYGSGRRGGGVSTLVCAVLDDRHAAGDDEEPKYSTFVRIGSGFSYADYVWIRGRPWKNWDDRHPPAFLQIATKGNEDKAQVYLEPEDSFIVKVKAAEITQTDLYHVGFTMRFPRALSIRDDLSVSDCMTASAVLENVRSEKKRKMEVDEEKPKKKRKTIAEKPSILPEYKGVNLKDVEVTSDLLEDMTFMVASDPKSRTRDADKEELLKVIRANGGKFVQIAKNHPGLLVVYGGTTTPYDIKLLINKGAYDIIRPQWILDSVASDSLVPMTKRYFFHATAERMESEEYNLPEDEVEPREETFHIEDTPLPDPTPKPEPEDEPMKDDTPEGLKDWFHVGDVGDSAEPIAGYESVTDADSDNEDVKEEPEEEDEWFDINAADSVDDEIPGGVSQLGVGEYSTIATDVKMGEEDTAMEYDQEHIFKHLRFYLDSPDNARQHSMPVNSKNEATISKSFGELSKLITDNGGRLSDLDDPKLTHVVLDKRDTSRRHELMKITSKPKRRNLVLSDFIQACLDEDTLLDEADFIP